MENTMQLVELFNNTDYRTYTFASFFDNDFICKSAIITVDSSGVLMDFSLTSENHGILRWENGEGVTECRLWEDNGRGRIFSGVNDLLVEDVIRDLPDDDLRNYIKRALREINFTEPLDIDFEA